MLQVPLENTFSQYHRHMSQVQKVFNVRALVGFHLHNPSDHTHQLFSVAGRYTFEGTFFYLQASEIWFVAMKGGEG